MSQNRQTYYGVGVPAGEPAPVPFATNKTLGSADYKYNIGQLAYESLLTQWVIYSGDGIWTPFSGLRPNIESISDSSNIPVYASGPSDTPPDNVQLLAGSGITIVSSPSSHLLTISAIATPQFTWSDRSGIFDALPGNGYFITGNTDATLPDSPSVGDTVGFCNATGNVVSIIASPGQTIRNGFTPSGVSGQFLSATVGDSIILVYNDTTTTWFAVPGSSGNWLPN